MHVRVVRVRVILYQRATYDVIQSLTSGLGGSCISRRSFPATRYANGSYELYAGGILV
jgi:hypothetical protein